MRSELTLRFENEQDLIREIAYALRDVPDRVHRRGARDPRERIARRVVEHLKISRWAIGAEQAADGEPAH